MIVRTFRDVFKVEVIPSATTAVMVKIATTSLASTPQSKLHPIHYLLRYPLNYPLMYAWIDITEIVV